MSRRGGNTARTRRRLAQVAVAALAVFAGATSIETASAATGPVPVIVDTDIYGSVDDVGALATAFGAQVKGEAQVIAIGVDTRTDRPATAPNSWKCAAAIAQFYNAGNVPIGTDKPDNNTWNIPDPNFIGPCAAKAAADTPLPDYAVTVYRRALASQPDGSVVMVGVGYLENLAALLNSPADGISSLTGKQLVTAKVKTL